MAGLRSQQYCWLHSAIHGHSQAATTHRYAHLDADPMRRAAEAIGSTVAAAMNRTPSAEVVPLKPSKG